MIMHKIVKPEHRYFAALIPYFELTLIKEDRYNNLCFWLLRLQSVQRIYLEI